MMWLQRSWSVLRDPDDLDFYPRARDCIGAVVLGSLLIYAAIGAFLAVMIIPWSRI